MIIGWTLSRHRFSLGSSLFANRTCSPVHHHPSMYTRRLYTILLHSCLHVSAQSGHAPPSIRLSECIDRDRPTFRTEAFWKIACSEFGLRDRFWLVSVSKKKKKKVTTFPSNSNEINRKLEIFFHAKIDSGFNTSIILSHNFRIIYNLIVCDIN